MDYPPALTKLVRECIRDYRDFPIPGVLFRDIFGVLANPKAFEALKQLLIFHCDNIKTKVHAVCALESRGFLFGPFIALHLQIPFVPIRKKGKLPGKVQHFAFNLEYGSEVLEIQIDALPQNSNVLVVDDLLATGGTLTAACKLIYAIGSKVDHCLAVIELESLRGKEKVPGQVYTMIKY